MDLQKHPVTIRIVKELSCLILGMKDGIVRIYKWPLDASDGSKDSHISDVSDANKKRLVDAVSCNGLKKSSPSCP